MEVIDGLPYALGNVIEETRPFEEWHQLLERAQHTTTVYTDHKNLEYFISAQVLN